MSALFSDSRYALSACEAKEREAQISTWLGRDLQQLTRFGLLVDNGVPWALIDRVLYGSPAVTVPLPRHFSRSQLTHVLEDAGLERIVVDAGDDLSMMPGGWQVDTDDMLGLRCWRRTIPVAHHRSLPAGTSKITYTSGSTGNPKGVCLSKDSLHAVVNSLASVLQPLGIGKHLCLLPLSTLLDNMVSVHVAPRLGAEVALPSLHRTGVGYGGLDIPRMLACIEQHSPESMLLVPELLRVLVAAVSTGWRAPSSLRFIAVGGASVSPVLLQAAHAAGLPAYEGYGLSECASVVALNLPGAERRGSVGRVLPHAAVRIDEHGEIHVRGATMLGYFGEQHGAGDEIATGDLGFVDADGFLHVRGRSKNLLITSLGRNISPEWVERELLATPAIAQAVVFGEAKPFLSAMIYPGARNAGAADLAAAVATANRKLPEYAQIRHWALLPEPLRVEDGSVTANGRVRRDVVFSRYRNLIEDSHADAIAS